MITICDLSGQILKEKKVYPNTKNEIKVDNLDSGAYLYRIYKNSEIITIGKMMKY